MQHSSSEISVRVSRALKQFDRSSGVFSNGKLFLVALKKFGCSSVGNDKLAVKKG